MTPHVIDVDKRSAAIQWPNSADRKVVGPTKVVGNLISRVVRAPRAQRLSARLSVGHVSPRREVPASTFLIVVSGMIALHVADSHLTLGEELYRRGSLLNRH
jgi:hypothetical protein